MHVGGRLEKGRWFNISTRTALASAVPYITAVTSTATGGSQLAQPYYHQYCTVHEGGGQGDNRLAQLQAVLYCAVPGLAWWDGLRWFLGDSLSTPLLDPLAATTQIRYF